MSGEGESRLKRWSRRKGQDRDGTPGPEEQEAENPDSAPVPVKRSIAPVMLPLAAEPEEGEIDMEKPSPEALELLQRHRAGELETLETPEIPEEEAELTPEQEEAVRNLPPIESLNKDSDFTPFLAQNVPDFLKRQAYRVLWRSDPFFGFRDGLDDYDEDFRLFKLIGEAIGGTKKMSKKGSGKKSKTAAKTGKDAAGGDEATQTKKELADEDEIDDVGEGDDDGEDFEEMAEQDSDKDENEGEEQA